MVKKEVDKKEINSLLNKKVRISYNPISNQVTRDIGIVYEITNDFVVLQLYDNKLKWIALHAIIRIEEIE